MTKETMAQQTVVDYATIAQEHILLACTDQIVPRKTVVYETLVDPAVIILSGERMKRHLFTKFGVRKPKSVPIELRSMEKYYEPFIVCSGRYFLDYYRMSDYTIPIDSDVTEVILINQKFYPKRENSTASIRLEGEERLVIEKKAVFMLDKNGQEASLETLPSAPSEKNPEETIKKYGIKEIDSSADVEFVRKRLVHRPENLSRTVSEIFEVGERVVIYAPRFRLTYVNAYSYEEKSVEFDGVTSKRIRDEKLHSRLAQAVKSTLNSILDTLT
jgi:hypothetical protein